MDKTQYEKAKKAVQASKPRENYLRITLKYNEHLVLPHKLGLAFLDVLNQAEFQDTSYGGPQHITALPSDQFKVALLSAQEYERYKIAALLNISVEDLKQYEQAPEPA